MNTIWATVSSYLIPSQNDRFAQLLMRLAEIAVECAAHFRKTEGRDLAAIIEYEHRADRVVDEIHELLDNSFILRLDVQDAMELTDELDNIIDGMRKVAIHLDIYQAQIKDLRPDAREVLTLGEEMVQQVRSLVAMLSN